ncbi:hypothetical protein LCGC14_0996260 [marine sediment metagenome]|uniref:Uncharacterized protein n=1 Tax=marine sediment metagenome TaxID=412755 RepID=A0A0F9QMT7_9ZZZZ
MAKVTVEPGAEKHLQERGMTRWDWMGFGLGVISRGYHEYREMARDGIITPTEIAGALGSIAEELEALFGADIEIKVTAPR